MWHKSSFIINETSNIIMKKKTVLFASCLLGTLAFSSCEKNLYDESKQPEKELQMKDLDIPADFQWKLTRTAEGTVSANTSTMVSLFLDEKCSEKEKIAMISVDAKSLGQQPDDLPLSLPTYVETLYAKYETENGMQSIPVKIVNGSFSLNIKDAKTTTTQTRAVTRGGDKGTGHDIEEDIRYSKGVVYHPKKDWGTIMYEDQFPILGDYDFNDFVINYKVKFNAYKEKGNKYMSNLMTIRLRIKALGGIYPYFPYLRLKEIDRDEVESVQITNPKTKDELAVEPMPNENLIIDCSDLILNLPKPAGSRYFNVEKTALVDTEELPEFEIEIKLNTAKEVKEILEDDEFDLYIARKDGDKTEIHANGIEPAFYKYPFNNPDLLPVYESDGDEEDDNYYFSKERLIWGLRVPGNVAHAIEAADFLKAYPGFKKWATSGGKNEQNWYGQGNADKSLLIYND